MEHAQKWYRDGLIVSNEMQKAVQDYIESQDFLSAFIDEFCVYGRNFSIPRKDFLKKLQEEYPKETRGYSDRQLTAMVEKIDNVSYRFGTGGKYYFYGIGWQGADEQQSLNIDDSNPYDLTPGVDVPF